MKRLTYLIAILVGLSFCNRPAFDPDLGWHLAGGRWVADSLAQMLAAGGNFDFGQIAPRQDFVNSFRGSWHDYHWLGQLVIYEVYRVGSYEGLQISLSLLMAFGCTVILHLVYLLLGRGGSPLIALFLAAPAWYAMWAIAAVRPQMISICGIALVVRRLVQSPAWWEPLYLFMIAVALVNIHIYWVFIPFLWGCYRCLPRLAPRYGAPSIAYAWGGLGLLVTAGLVSPYGMAQSGLSLRALLVNYALAWDLLHTSEYLTSTITEFSSPFVWLGWVPLLLTIYFAITVRTFRPRSALKYIGPFSSAMVSLWLSVRAGKFFGLFGVIALPYLIICLRPAARRLNRSTLLRPLQPIAVWGTALAVVALLYSAVSALARVPVELANNLPFEACGHIAALGLTPTHGRDHVRVLTDFDYGGWCRWVVYEENPALDIRVTTDGRTQGFAGSHFKKSADLYRLREGWPKTLDEWAPDVILASREHPLSHLLPLMKDQWRNVFGGSDFTLYVARTTDENP